MNDLSKKIKVIFENHTSPITAISRKELAIAFLSSDRYARDMVKEARLLGIPIVSSSRGSGYWLNHEDYKRIHLPEVISRLRSEKQILDSYFSTNPDQINIFEVLK